MELRIVKFDWSQEQLADRLGWNRTFISRVETSQQNITIKKLNELCNGLDVTLKDFFSTFDTPFIEEKEDDE